MEFLVKTEEEMLALGEKFGQHLARRTGTISSATSRSYDESECAEKIVSSVSQLPQQTPIIELLGDVGTGKTTFTRGLAKGLGVQDPVTSPSFTISKQYAFPKSPNFPTGGRLIHYDFYRLPDPGLMSDDLAEAIADPQNIVVIEWGQDITDLLPKNHLAIKLTLQPDGSRLVKIY